MNAEDQQKMRDLYHEVTKATRRQQIATAECQPAIDKANAALRLFDLELHKDCPAGQCFDVWGDGELKPVEQCQKPPGMK